MIAYHKSRGAKGRQHHACTCQYKAVHQQYNNQVPYNFDPMRQHFLETFTTSPSKPPITKPHSAQHKMTQGTTCPIRCTWRGDTPHQFPHACGGGGYSNSTPAAVLSTRHSRGRPLVSFLHCPLLQLVECVPHHLLQLSPLAEIMLPLYMATRTLSFTSPNTCSIALFMSGE